MTRYNPTERLGVTEVEKIFLRSGWIPRNILQTDVGIDMTVEICKGGNPKGKFIAIQIKTGESYFKEKTTNHIIFRPEKAHVDYWLDYSLPVLIVLHNIESGLAIWQVVNKQTVEKVGHGYKIKIPVSNILNENFIDRIEKLTETPPLLNKFQKLLLDKPMIDLIKSGEKIIVELDEWVNKTSGRAYIRVFQVIQDENPNENITLEQKLLAEYSAIGIRNYQTLYHFYPWAYFDVDETFYENYSDYDEDSQPGYKNAFIEECFHDSKLSIVPYESNVEIDSYRLVMSLNDFGITFIDFYDYIVENKQLKLTFD